MVYQEEVRIKTAGEGDIVDITGLVEAVVRRSGISDGVAHVFAIGSTAAISTMEYEPGLLKDLPELMEKLVPSNRPYQHDHTWHDGNGFSHLRSALIGPAITVPFVAGELVLGTWQQVVFLEFDNRPRSRRVVLQIIGE